MSCFYEVQSFATNGLARNGFATVMIGKAVEMEMMEIMEIIMEIIIVIRMNKKRRKIYNEYSYLLLLVVIYVM